MKRKGEALHREHHQQLRNSLEHLLVGSELAGQPLAKIVEASEGPLRRAASLVWSHDVFFDSIAAKATAPTDAFVAAVERDFGSVEDLEQALLENILTVFEYGFVWLVEHNNKLAVVKTTKDETPIHSGKKVLLAIDCWEHAYLFDFGLSRKRYGEHILSHLDWSNASKNLARRSPW